MWWVYVLFVALVGLGGFGFVSLTGYQTRWFTSRTTRRAEDLYSNFADEDDPEHKRRRRRRR
jgi:hypothetical protein